MAEETPSESAQQAADNALARIHREYRDECIKLGTYRGIDPKSVEKEIARWKKECSRPPRKSTRNRKHPPKGTAD